MAYRQLIYDVQTVSVRIQSIRDNMAAHLGVTTPQFNILMVVAHFGEGAGVTIKETAAQIHVSGAFVTGEVKKLIRHGLLVKRTDDDDRRKVRLTLTEAANARLENLTTTLRDVNDAFLELLSAKDFQALAAIAAGLADSSHAAMNVLDGDGNTPLLLT